MVLKYLSFEYLSTIYPKLAVDVFGFDRTLIGVADTGLPNFLSYLYLIFFYS